MWEAGIRAIQAEVVTLNVHMYNVVVVVVVIVAEIVEVVDEIVVSCWCWCKNPLVVQWLSWVRNPVRCVCVCVCVC